MLLIIIAIIILLIIVYYIYFNKIQEGNLDLYGINLGGIYLLEDWFYSDKNTTFKVATSKESPEGVITKIFPSLKSMISNNEKFYGECDLIRILKNYNFNNLEIYNLFDRHRNNYILNLPYNFQQIKRIGIKVIRLPLTWCIKYNHEYIINGLNNNWTSINKDSLIVKDPYFDKLNWCVINIKDIENILDLAHHYGLKILIDIHTFPGGQSDGSYSGQWPYKPRFWNDIDVASNNMITIMKNMCNWIINLNKNRYNTIYGISPMNEPAHLRTNEKINNGWGINDNDILYVLSKSVDVFKSYPMLMNEKKLVMNVIETSIYPQENWKYVYGRWWKNITTKKDRTKWAAIDIHHYVAWDNPKFCSNTKECIRNIKNYNVYSKLRKDLELDNDDLLYSTEFSASTDSSTNKSLTSGLLKNNNHEHLRNMFLSKQLSDMKQNNVKGFFWCWSIPYNSNYQNEWSLKNIL